MDVDEGDFYRAVGVVERLAELAYTTNHLDGALSALAEAISCEFVPYLELDLPSGQARGANSPRGVVPEASRWGQVRLNTQVRSRSPPMPVFSTSYPALIVTIWPPH